MDLFTDYIFCEKCVKIKKIGDGLAEVGSLIDAPDEISEGFS